MTPWVVQASLVGRWEFFAAFGQPLSPSARLPACPRPQVKLKVDIAPEVVAGRHVLLVEDIVDTGLTLTRLRRYLLEECKAASCCIVTLLDKKERRKVPLVPDYTGFEVRGGTEEERSQGGSSFSLVTASVTGASCINGTGHHHPRQRALHSR